jgi:hypothetical protein
MAFSRPWTTASLTIGPSPPDLDRRSARAAAKAALTEAHHMMREVIQLTRIHADGNYTTTTLS